jgi:FixJ family two-component response regulator
MDAFAVGAIDYILKPFDDARLARTVISRNSSCSVSRSWQPGAHVRTAIEPLPRSFSPTALRGY